MNCHDIFYVDNYNLLFLTISISPGKDLGLDPEETGAGSPAGRGGALGTGDSLAQGPETGRETGDPKTETKKRMVIRR